MFLDPSDWKNYYKTVAKRLNNKCHTLGRDKCYDELTEEQYREESSAGVKAAHAHLFYKSPSCSVALGGSLLKFSIYGLISLLSILLI